MLNGSTFVNFLHKNKIKFITKDVAFLLNDFGSDGNVLSKEKIVKFIKSNVWDN